MEKWGLPATLLLSFLALGNSMYQADKGELSEQVIRLESRHNSDIDGIRRDIRDMENTIVVKLDKIIEDFSSISSGVAVNSVRLDNVEKENNFR